LSIHDEAAPNTRPENNGECHRCALSSAIGGFGQRKAVSIVFNANRAFQHPLEIRLQWLAIEARGISISHPTRLNRQGTRYPQTNRRATRQISFRAEDQLDDRL
jgi:hypothetical protein